MKLKYRYIRKKKSKNKRNNNSKKRTRSKKRNHTKKRKKLYNRSMKKIYGGAATIGLISAICLMGLLSTASVLTSGEDVEQESPNSSTRI